MYRISETTLFCQHLDDLPQALAGTALLLQRRVPGAMHTRLDMKPNTLGWWSTAITCYNVSLDLLAETFHL